MRKNIARKCLCIALASAMMLGEAGTAMAASVENAADGRTAATVAAEEQADVAAANVSIWYAGAYTDHILHDLARSIERTRLFSGGLLGFRVVRC